MSYMDCLPLELKEMIFKKKFYLETKDLQAFVDDFDVSIISTTKLNEFKDRYEHITRYRCMVHLMYKPTKKCLIIPYSFPIINKKYIHPSAKDIVYSLSYDAYYMKERDWIYIRKANREWDINRSYKNYINNSNEHGYMSIKKYVYWKNIVKKLEIVLEDRFTKFIKCYQEEL
jgi:hypothetical protein